MVYLLFFLYAVELLLMVASMSYAFVLLCQKKRYLNQYLKGRRLIIAGYLPVIWFIYIYSDAYEVWKICEAAGWQVSDASVEWKAFRQGLSTIGAVITLFLLSGYDFD